MPHHVVVDGSNLATEGRTQPSLHQLNEAVLAYMADHPTALITVVVDATFGHRIDPREVPEFDDAVANNELVAPPAGAIGRGDAFVLSIANKVNATIISNDSYQEFHGQYPWLFDEGRLVGGKPVPHIGWVYVNRLPVRGPLSRKSVSEAKRKGPGTVGRGRSAASDGTVRVGSPEASMPMPVPKSPPPRAAASRAAPAEAAPAKSGRRGRGGADRSPKAEAPAANSPAAIAEAAAHPAKSTVNDLLSFLTFVERHPAGTSVNAIVDHYSSHGAYVRIDDVIGYVPLRLMADPAPRSAREFMKVGESVTLVVESFVPSKRSIDLAVPVMGTAAPLGEAAPAKPSKRTSKKSTSPAATTDVAAVVETPVRGRGRKAAAPSAAPVPIAESAQKPSPRGRRTEPPAGDAARAAATVKPAKAAGSSKSAAPSKTGGASKAARKPSKAAPAKAATGPTKAAKAGAVPSKAAASKRATVVEGESGNAAAAAKPVARRAAKKSGSEPAAVPAPAPRRGRTKT